MTKEENKKEKTTSIKKLTRYREDKYVENNDIEEEIKDNKKEDIEDIDELEEEKPKRRILLKLFLIIILIVLYSIYIEPKYLFKVNEYSITTSKIDNEMNGLKIVELSDIHYGTSINKKQLERVINKIIKIKPDIIVFTGDIFDKNINLSKNNINDIKNIFNKLKDIKYKYAIYGDNDYKYKDQYIELINNIGFTLLDNNNTLIYLDSNTPIEIIGINKYNNPDYNIITNSINEIDTSNLYKIVLDHEIDNIDNYLNYNPDLVLTAHSLGGLINIPFIGRIINTEGAKIYKEDYTKINNTEVYNSNGIGTSNLNVRFNNFPSINLYRIYKS